MSADRLTHRLLNWIIGGSAHQGLPRRQELQAHMAVCTSVLAAIANAATILYAHDSLPPEVLRIGYVTFVLFASVAPIYRWLGPRWPPAIELANNLIPGAVFLFCSYTALTLGGQLSLTAIYAGTIPVLSTMICRRPFSWLWSVLVICVLAISLVIEPNQEYQSASWLTLAGGITMVIPTLLSVLMNRADWEKALDNAANARKRLRDKHEDQRILERRLAAYERQESLGLMAGRVAHDLNNLLTAVLTSVELTKIAATQGQLDEVHSSVDTIEHAARSAGELSSQLLNYTGKQHHTLVRIPLSDRMPTAMTLAQAASPPKTQVTLETAPDVFVEGDATQLDQVIVNLVRNAAQSYEPKTGLVELTLHRIKSPTTIRCTIGESLPPGNYARLRVKDFGAGISSEKVDRIFEPFFTESKSGKGLGLAAVGGIVSAHGGGIVVESRISKGTTFSVFLPLAAVEESGGSMEITTTDLPLDSTGQILIADDERAVRETLARLLRNMGHDVLLAENGQQAVEVFDNHESIVAVILDISMPVMDGYEALSNIRTRNANIPVLLISGYASSYRSAVNEDYCTEFLTKPFAAADLENRLNLMGVNGAVKN